MGTILFIEDTIGTYIAVCVSCKRGALSVLQWNNCVHAIVKAKLLLCNNCNLKMKHNNEPLS